MKNTYTFMAGETKVELVAEVEFITRNKTTNLDGDVFVLDKKETITNATLTALVDGEVFTICKDINFWVMIDTGTEGIERLWGIEGIGFTSEMAREIEKFLEDVIEGAKSDDIKKEEAKRKEEDTIREIEKAKKVIEKAEKQQSIPTLAEVRQKEKDWNNLYNEGGEGYTPHIISKEEYENAKKVLSHH